MLTPIEDNEGNGSTFGIPGSTVSWPMTHGSNQVEWIFDFRGMRHLLNRTTQKYKTQNLNQVRVLQGHPVKQSSTAQFSLYYNFFTIPCNCDNNLSDE